MYTELKKREVIQNVADNFFRGPRLTKTGLYKAGVRAGSTAGAGGTHLTSTGTDCGAIRAIPEERNSGSGSAYQCKG